MTWYDGLTDFEAFIKSMDMYERLDADYELIGDIDQELEYLINYEMETKI